MATDTAGTLAVGFFLGLLELEGGGETGAVVLSGGGLWYEEEECDEEQRGGYAGPNFYRANWRPLVALTS